jgi:hypothetical protein
MAWWGCTSAAENWSNGQKSGFLGTFYFQINLGFSIAFGNRLLFQRLLFERPLSRRLLFERLLFERLLSRRWPPAAGVRAGETAETQAAEGIRPETTGWAQVGRSAPG